MCSSLVHRLPLPILAIVIAAFGLPISAQTYDAENDLNRQQPIARRHLQGTAGRTT